jgi:hypothetical protein
MNATQEFVFDFDVRAEDGSLVIYASFELKAEGIDPAQTLSDISTSLSVLLAGSSEQFKSVATSFGVSFNSAAELFASIAKDERITLLMNANINAEATLKLSFESISFATNFNDLNMALQAQITDSFDIEVGGFGYVHVTPSVQLRLQVENLATPFDAVQNPSAFEDFWYAGDFKGSVNIGMDNVPADITLRAYSPYLLQADSLEFGVSLDVDLVPIRDSECKPFSIPCRVHAFVHSPSTRSFYVGLDTILKQIELLSYPTWVLDSAPYLPKLDLACVSNAGSNFLYSVRFSPAPVSGFIDAISEGCSSDFVISGGYDIDKQELRIDIVNEKHTGLSM